MMDIWDIVLFIGIVSVILLLVKWITNTNEGPKFKELIEPNLKKHGLEFINSTNPGLFEVGPFKKFEMTIGKPLINGGTIPYEKTFYRVIELKTKKNKVKQIWAKIETSKLKDTVIEFKPPLSKIK